MAGMSISGLASGLDTTTIVSQLIQLEARPQTLLKTKLSDTKTDALAYRAINTAVASLQSAAEALTKATAWTPAKASSSSTTVSATSGAGATTGSSTFTVKTLAAPHTMISGSDWVAPTGLTTVAVQDAAGDSPGFSVDLATGTSLADAVTAINAAAVKAGAGVTASAINTGSGTRLQLSAQTSGLDGTFTISGGLSFATLSTGSNAELTVGSGSYTFPVTSSSNTFTDLIPGTTVTVSKAGETATVAVASDPAAVTSAVQALVTAANGALSKIDELGNNRSGSTAALRGDSSLRALTGQILDAVSFAVGKDGSVASAGLQLTGEGKLKFDSAAFSDRLAADPALTQRLVNGSGTGAGAVPGVAQRLLAVAKTATDTTTGTLVSLANGKEREATDLQKRVDDWDLRLDLREQTLTRQFTAMESALSSLRNQSSWLSSQLASLPSWSKSDN